ncbi:polysaccharide biosynthesis tyrosine autokinase [Frateuria defendens]|uniref:polysaccharide biosynthesis tyrosine autokinase n=1 Tax=Frateuria defendens TaxID=2219559 RepID=UPI00066FF967|nr:polysaccharide biosynthesis tyrosine autokinase [Frateuria defendens]
MTAKQTFPSSPRRDDDVDLRALLGTLLDHKWLIAGVTAAFCVLSVLYAVLATPIYEASATVQVEQKVPSLPGLDDLTQTLGASTSQATTEIALLTSRTVIGQAVTNLKLDIDVEPKRFPLIGDFIARRYAPDKPGDVAPPLGGMNSYDWGGAELNIFQLDVPSGLLDQPLHIVAGEQGAYTLMDDDDNVLLWGRVGESATAHGITIQVQSLRANPGTRFDVARYSHLATITALQQGILAVEQGKDSGIIEMTYRNPDPVLATQLLDQVSSLYVRQNVERNSAEAANSLKFVKEQLPKVKMDLEQASRALNAFQTRARSVDISLQTKGLLDQVVALDTNIAQLGLQMADVEHRFTRNHPNYQALAQQIGGLQGKKAALERQVGQLPNTQQELLRLTRDVQVSNQTYTSLLNQAQQLDIARAGTVGNVRVVDRAATNTAKPVWPRRILVVLGGTVLGGLLALAFIFVRQMLKRGVEDLAAIEHVGLPVYACVPLSAAEREIAVRAKGRRHGSAHAQHLLAQSEPEDLAVEALRSLRTSLHFARLEAKNNLLMIASPGPAAGKTFVGANLAAVIAQAGQRVLLLDADMRKGALHTLVGGRPEDGLSELIAGQITLAQAIRPVEGAENLYFIARGKVPPNPSELLMHAHFTALLDKLKPRFDLIIIDTPPVLAVTDAAVIGHHAGTSLMVVRFGLNQTREIALAKQRLEQNGVALKGAIFNAVEKRSAGYYAYAYYEYATTKA